MSRVAAKALPLWAAYLRAVAIVFVALAALTWGTYAIASV